LALESLGISLDTVRQQVQEIIGPGQGAPSGPIPFTAQAKAVLELSLSESSDCASSRGHNAASMADYPSVADHRLTVNPELTPTGSLLRAAWFSLPLLLVGGGDSGYRGQEKPAGDGIPESNVVAFPRPRYDFCSYEPGQEHGAAPDQGELPGATSRQPAVHSIVPTPPE
jgi:hypothetical protein